MQNDFSPPAGAAPAPAVRLPGVALADADTFSGTDVRSEVLGQKKDLRAQREDASNEARALAQGAPERQALYRRVQSLLSQEEALEGLLKSQFIPLHGARQLLSPRSLFVSPLFRVRSKAIPRERYLEFSITAATGAGAIRYAGPELRQSDGLVFLALINMARDVRVGKSVSFSAEELCRALQGQYNGPARQRLRDSIQRLQQALLKFETFSVQLCQRFDYPSQGRWTVALDPQIVELFSRVPPVWLDLGRRLSLPEGLSTWLYAFVESQTSLIPMKTEALRVLCGSESSSRAFENKLRDALKHLNEHGVIDEGWSIQKGVLRWRKAQASSAYATPALSLEALETVPSTPESAPSAPSMGAM